MAEPLKNLYNLQFFKHFARSVRQVQPQFNEKQFFKQLFDEQWEEKELKQRMRHIAAVLNYQLQGSYKEQVATIIRIIERLKTDGINGSFEYMFLPDFIEQFGQQDVNTSLKAMEKITQFASCEFAIRPFLLHDPAHVMTQMLEWSRHPHHHVRRFSSEGCRPRLPWAMAIPQLINDPSPILPILENLKNDASLFVRKSVANNVNDISKDHPELVVELAKSWKGHTTVTNWIIRHGCRTLLKKAHPSAYNIFGLNETTTADVLNFNLDKSKLRIGNSLSFSFQLKTGKHSSKLRLEYAVYYQKANNNQSRKIFQIREAMFEGGRTYSFNKQQSFAELTTRKHYPGLHKLAIVLNGKEVVLKEFELSR